MADTYDIKIVDAGDANAVRALNAELEKTRATIREIGSGGIKATTSEVEALIRKREQLSNAVEKLGASGAGGLLPPPLPKAAGAGLSASSVAAGVGVAAAAIAVGFLVKNLADGAREASQLAKGLDSLGTDEKADRIKQLGELANVLERNSGILIEYGRNWEEASRKGSDFFTAAGTGLAPVLNSIAEAINAVPAAKLGEDFGLLAGGILKVLNPLTALESAWKNLPPEVRAGIGVAGDIATGGPFRKGVTGFLSDANEEDNRRAAAIQDKRLDEEFFGKIDAANARAALSPAERIAAARRKLGSGGTGEREEALRELSTLEPNVLNANLDAITSLEDAKAKRRGDSQAIRENAYISTYGGLIKRGVSPELAQQLANEKDLAANDPGSVRVSSLASRGGGVAESLAAARAATNGSSPLDQQRVLELQARQLERSNTLLEQIRTGIEQIEIKTTNYQ